MDQHWSWLELTGDAPVSIQIYQVGFIVLSIGASLAGSQSPNDFGIAFSRSTGFSIR